MCFTHGLEAKATSTSDILARGLTNVIIFGIRQLRATDGSRLYLAQKRGVSLKDPSSNKAYGRAVRKRRAVAVGQRNFRNSLRARQDSHIPRTIASGARSKFSGPAW